jgi:hypothetical protein
MRGNLVSVFYVDENLKKEQQLPVGWHISFSDELLGSIEPGLWQQKAILNKPFLYVYRGTNTVRDVLSHDSYNKPI